MPVHPQLAPWLAEFNDKVAKLKAGGYLPTAIGAREALAGVTRVMVEAGPALPWVNDELIPGRDYTVPVRIYHPAPQEARAVIVYYHGGGHTAGSVSVYDPICRRIAAASGHIVVSVEYRLAPENPYPAGLNDAYAAARGVWAALDKRGLPYKRELTVAGDSAGGALAASVSGLSQHDPSLPIARQVLLYPSLDYTLSQPSVRENGSGYFLDAPRTAWYFDNYFQRAEDRRAASPLFWHYDAAMPKTLILACEYDPLRDEAAAYAARLSEAGAYCRHQCLPGMLHAFLCMEALVPQECAATYRAIADFVNE